MWLHILPNKLPNTSTLDGCDNAAGWLLNSYDYKWLTLHWCSPLSSPSRHTNSHCVLNNCTKNTYSLYWQPEYSFNVSSFESKIFETCQFLSHCHTHHFHYQWGCSIGFQRFRLAIYCIKMHSLVLDINSLTSSPFHIQLIVSDLQDIR